MSKADGVLLSVFFLLQKDIDALKRKNSKAKILKRRSVIRVKAAVAENVSSKKEETGLWESIS